VMIGGNVTYRPGAKMVKIQSDPKTYAVDAGGVLRWVKNEAVASALYGADWNTKIDDVPDAFFVNYKLGADVNASSDYSPSAALPPTASIDDALAAAAPPANPPPPPTPTPAPAPQGTTEAGLIIAGHQNEVLAKYRLTATSEELELVKVRIALLVPASA